MCRWFIFKRYLLVSFIGMTFSYCGNSTTESNQTVSVKTTGTGDTFVIPKAQTSGRLVSNTFACYFDKVNSTEMALNIIMGMANPRETQLVQSMMSYTGVPANFSIYRGDVSNALATQYRNERLIIYNKDLFSRIDRESDSYWSSVSIIAHEIGHHLSFNLHSSNSIELELEADQFVAAILYKMGADSSLVQLAVRSNSYPIELTPKHILRNREDWKPSNKVG